MNKKNNDFLYVFLFVMLLLQSSCATKKATWTTDDLYKNDGLLFDQKTDQPITGVAIFTSPTSETSEYEFKDGKPDGVAKLYTQNGKLEREITYKNGIMNGITQIFYPSGKLRISMHFKDGVQHGLSKTYYENGVLEDKLNYFMGKRKGTGESYYEWGDIEREVIYENDIAVSGFSVAVDGERKEMNAEQLKEFNMKDE